MVFSLQVERIFPRKSLCLVLVIYFRIPQVLGIRFLFPTDGSFALEFDDVGKK